MSAPPRSAAPPARCRPARRTAGRASPTDPTTASGPCRLTAHSCIHDYTHRKSRRKPMAAQPRQMTMIAFLQAQNCSNLPASWRHPASATDFLTPDYYQRIGRVLEDGKFHMAFFDDRLAMPDIYSNDYRNTVENG